MPSRDLMNNVKVVSSLVPLVRTADAKGAGVDLQGFESCAFIAHVGAAGDTWSSSVKIEFEVQESNDDVDGNYTACADADVQGAVAGATNTGTFLAVTAGSQASKIYKGGYRGSKRWVRVVANFSGTHTNGSSISVTTVLGHPSNTPVA